MKRCHARPLSMMAFPPLRLILNIIFFIIATSSTAPASARSLVVDVNRKSASTLFLAAKQATTTTTTTTTPLLSSPPKKRWPRPCQSSSSSSEDSSAAALFCDPTLPLATRIKLFRLHLSVEERADFLGHDNQWHQWWSEGLHGVASSPGVRFQEPTPCATSTAMPILTSSSFNDTLFHEVGQVVGKEARVFVNVGNGGGVTFFSPNINIFRDPRWGRGAETPGEDPLLNGRYAKAYVTGLQTNYSLSATCKHYAAYSLENWHNVTRFEFDAEVTLTDMADTYLPAFRECAAAASSVMCSYNSVNGMPSCFNAPLMRQLASYDFKNGYTVTDCTAIDWSQQYHHTTPTRGEATMLALQAGIDVNCGDNYQQVIPLLINNDTLSVDVLDRAFDRAASVLFRLGYFDPPGTHPALDALGPKDVDTAHARQVAVETVAQGVVLLENKNRALPLSKEKTKTILVAGPQADDAQMQLGTYAGIACSVSTLLGGIRKHLKEEQTEVLYAKGCLSGVSCTSTEGFDEAEKMASRADVIVVGLGINKTVEAEFLDRTELTIPGHQEQLLDVLRSAAPEGTPIVVILFSGGPVDTRKVSQAADALMWAGYPGQAGGDVLAPMLFGDGAPTGKLTQTWYHADFAKEVSMFDMHMRPRPPSYPGRTYRFYTGNPLYKFGHGLKYEDSEVDYFDSSLRVTRSGPKQKHSSLSLRISLRNEGSRDTDESVLVFHEPPRAVPSKQRWWTAPPQRTLVAYKRVALKAGSTIDVDLAIPDDRVLAVGGHLAVDTLRIDISEMVLK